MDILISEQSKSGIRKAGWSVSWGEGEGALPSLWVGGLGAESCRLSTETGLKELGSSEWEVVLRPVYLPHHCTDGCA